MFRFITHRSFLFNLITILVLLAGIIFVFLLSLDYFTNHGKILRVPAVTGKSVEEARTVLEEQGFDVTIQDSVYIDSLPALSVTRQFPDPELSVKIHRTVYLTVNRAVAPYIDMPNLLNMSYRSAAEHLQSVGLKLGDTSYRPDFAKNAVIMQLMGNQEIKPGSKIQMGSVVSLVFGSGLSNEEIAVPDLFGLTLSEADVLLAASGLSRGATVFDSNVRDSSAAYIYKQSPERMDEAFRINRIRPGQLITIWTGTEKPVRPEIPVSDSVMAD